METSKQLIFDKRPSLESSVLFCAFVLVFMLWVYAGFSKFFEMDKFIFQIGRSPFKFLAGNRDLFGRLIPIIEIAIALALLVERFRRRALYLSASLLLIFEIYIALMMMGYEHLPCACGGIIEELGWAGHLIFNAVFIVFSVMSLKLEYPRVRKRE